MPRRQLRRVLPQNNAYSEVATRTREANLDGTRMEAADAVEYVVGDLIGLLASAVLWKPAFQETLRGLIYSGVQE